MYPQLEDINFFCKTQNPEEVFVATIKGVFIFHTGEKDVTDQVFKQCEITHIHEFKKDVYMFFGHKKTSIFIYDKKKN
jgi:hypothetical protein